MKKIKILFGLEACEGGAAVHLLYILKNIDKKLFNITVIASTHRKNSTFYIEEFKKYSEELILYPLEREVNFLKDLFAFFKIRKFLNKNNFDIIHLHSSKAGFLFRISFMLNKKRPAIIYSPHHYHFQSLNGFKKKCFIALERLAGIFTDYTIVASEYEKSESLNHKIVSHDKIFLLKNAIEMDFYTIAHSNDPSVIKKKLNIPEGNFVIGSVGRFTKQKDWFTFLEICKNISRLKNNITFLLIGYGELEHEIIDLIQSYGLTTNCVMLKNEYSIQNFYLIMDLFVNTSLWEGFSYTLMEAMRMKRCIIVSNIPGNSELIINGKNGFLITPGDVEKYTAVSLELIKNDKLRTLIGETAFSMINEINSIPEFISIIQNLYIKSLIETPNSN